MRHTRLIAALPLLATAAGLSAAPAPAPAPRAIRVGGGPVAQAPASLPGPSPVMQVNTGRGRLVTLARPMSDLFIADDTIADVQVRSPTQLYIFGKKPGETTISATAHGGGVVYAATVRVGNNFDSIGQMLTLAMPEAHITATPMNGLVLLTGTVAAPDDAAEAERLVQAFVGDQTKVLSRLRTATPLQVSLRVRFAEVSRSFVKNIGANFASVDRTGGFQFGAARGRGPGGTIYTPGGPLGVGFTAAPTGGSQVTQSSGATVAGLAGRLLGLDLLGSLDLGETIGQVSTLASPNLTAMSGETGIFLAGGEFPVVTSSQNGTSVEYKSYGVSISYTPTVLSNGRIVLRVKPEVSQLSAQGSVQLNGTTIPALTTRRAETTLELGSGQSMVIGGLLSNDSQNSIDKTPGLGDLPILGALFRSNGWRRNETELMIVITPYLVQPVDNPGDIVLPTDGLRNASDAQRILLGELGTGQSGERRPVPTMAAPTAPNPTTGALTPVAPQPLRPQPRQKVADDRAIPAARHAPAPTPGFSN